MLGWLKRWVAKYDQWCLSLGLTPENKRSCVPYRSESKPSSVKSSKAQQ